MGKNDNLPPGVKLDPGMVSGNRTEDSEWEEFFAKQEEFFQIFSIDIQEAYASLWYGIANVILKRGENILLPR